MKFPFVSRSRLEQFQDREALQLDKIKELRARLAKVKLRESRSREHQLSQDQTIERLRGELEDLRLSRSRLLDRMAGLGRSPAKVRSEPIPLMIGIDVEPDARTVDRADPSWRGTARFFERLPELRQMLQEVSGVPYVPLTWFLRADPQVQIANGDAAWALRTFAAQWQMFKAAGDEIGIHMHPWRWDEADQTWVQDHGNEEWVVHCLRTALDAFQNHFGYTVRSYRGGDRFLSQAVIDVLEEQGVTLDLSLERMPTVDRLVPSERGTGCIPGAPGLANRAYRPASSNFRVPDPAKSTGIGILPLTGWREQSLSPWLPNTLFDEAIEDLLHETELPTHFAFVVRSQIAASDYWEPFVENARSLARRVRLGHVRFATACQTWELASRSMRPHP